MKMKGTTLRMENITGAFFQRKVRVESYQIGAAGHVRLSALLRMEQETGDEHMDALGLSYERLYQEGLAILLTANRVQIHRFPARNEELTVTTTPHGTAGVQMYRNFSFESGGETLATIRQVTVCADPKTHKPLRPDALYRYGAFEPMTTPREDRVPRLRPPEDLPFLGERPIRYSDLDMNQHLTNTIYGDIVEDFLPESFRAYRFAEIHYLSESFLGETLQIHGKVLDGERFLLTGQNQRGTGFSAVIAI